MTRATRLSRFASFVLLSVVASALSANPWDGPYVGRDAANQWNALWVEANAERLSVRQQKVAVGDAIEVPAVGARPAFTVRLRDPAVTQSEQIALPVSVPLFVMADTHGEFEIATEVLLRHRIVDDKLAWSFGKGHLVLLGDVFDRGPNHTELLWLIYKLEAEAAKAGGAVHFVLGNHETMVMLGDDRYLHRKYPQTARVLKAPNYAALWGLNSMLGQWLRTKAAVMKIGDYLCLHGGVSPEVVSRKLTLASMNSTVRDALQARHALPQPEAHVLTFMMGPNGPLWYRGYFSDARAEEGSAAQPTTEQVDGILKHFEVKRILIGHTRVPTITPMYEGKVIAVQVYPHRDEQSGAPVMESLLVRDGKLFRARANGSLEPLEQKAK